MSEFDNRSHEDVEYGLNLPFHLAEADLADDLCDLLTEFEFIEYKVSALAPQPIIDDYELALQPNIRISEEAKESLKLIQGAIELSANTLTKDSTQLAAQLLGRLMSFDEPEVQRILEQSKLREKIWVRPLKSSLTPPGGSLWRTLTHGDWSEAVVVTQDSKLIISGGIDNIIRVWDLKTRIEQFSMISHTGAINTLAVTPDGQWVISGSDDHTLKVWNLKTRGADFTLEGHRGKVNCVGVTSNGKQIVSASDDRTIKVWSLEQKRKLFTLKGHKGGVKSITITWDNRSIISASYDKTIKVWDVEKKCERFSLIGHTEAVYTVAVIPNRELLISGSADQTIKIWNLITREEILNLTAHNLGHSLTVTPDGKNLISSSWGKIVGWNIATGEKLFVLMGHDSPIQSLTLTSDGKKLISSSRDKINNIKIWNLHQVHEFHPAAEDLYPIADYMNSISIETIIILTNTLICQGRGENVEIINIKTGEKVKILKSHDRVRSVITTREKKHIISGLYDGKIIVWDLKKKKKF